MKKVYFLEKKILREHVITLKTKAFVWSTQRLFLMPRVFDLFNNEY